MAEKAATGEIATSVEVRIVECAMPVVTQKLLSWFKDGAQARRDLGSEGDLRNLGESMRVRQLGSVGAMADGEMIYGFRRLKAARIVGLTHLDVTIYDEMLDASEIKCMNLTENFQRLDLTPHEKWSACEELRHLNPSWTAKELANYVKLDPSAVTKWLSPSKCIPAWQEALKANQVGITECYIASQLPKEEQLGLLEMKLAGASRETLGRFAQRVNRSSNGDSVRSSRVTIPFSDGTRVVVSGKGLTLSDVIDKLAECADAARKGLRDRLDAKTWQHVMRHKSTVPHEGVADV